MNDLKNDIKQEMEGIIWTADDVTTNKAVNTTKETVKNDEIKNENETAAPKAETTNKGNEKAAEQTEAKKKRNVTKFGNKNWSENLPEDKQFNENTIFCFNPDKQCKIGRFKSYGKKEGIIWLEMFKKDSFTPMSREWAVRIDECEFVEKDGVLTNPEKYTRDEKGYHVVKTDKKAGKAKVVAEVKPAEEIKPVEEEKAEGNVTIPKKIEVNKEEIVVSEADNTPTKEIAAETEETKNEAEGIETEEKVEDETPKAE